MNCGKGKLLLQFVRWHYEFIRNVRGGITVPLKIEKLSAEKLEAAYRRRKENPFLDSNPGIGNRLELMTDRHGKIEEDVEYEDFENLEGDLSQAHHAYTSFYDEVHKDRERKSRFNVYRKHFKPPKLPNMLTYIEKQQIKQLHKEDPNTWCYERLAESFPATPKIIHKIVTSGFTAYTTEQVETHDKIVRKNWDLFKQGKLELDEELTQKYKKFSNRDKLRYNEKEIKKYLPEPVDFSATLATQEFGSIIDNYRKSVGQVKSPVKEESGKTIYTVSGKVVKTIDEDDLSHAEYKHYTLSELRQSIAKQSPNRVSELDQLISEAPKNVKTPEKYSENALLDCAPLESKGTSTVDKTYERSIQKIEEKVLMRIRIPKDMWKRNKVFRVKDCFYDDDGYFLYRVPGLF